MESVIIKGNGLSVRVDGHDYVNQALRAGACCALVQRVPEGVSGACIVVPDTVAALQRIAAFYRAQFDIPVLGITGSVGKTTAKEGATGIVVDIGSSASMLATRRPSSRWAFPTRATCSALRRPCARRWRSLRSSGARIWSSSGAGKGSWRRSPA